VAEHVKRYYNRGERRVHGPHFTGRRCPHWKWRLDKLVLGKKHADGWTWRFEMLRFIHKYACNVTPVVFRYFSDCSPFYLSILVFLVRLQHCDRYNSRFTGVGF
jgi:hypothetical protein